jgi:hypothetical protein
MAEDPLTSPGTTPDDDRRPYEPARLTAYGQLQVDTTGGPGVVWDAFGFIPYSG